jgi:hypothetical protein
MDAPQTLSPEQREALEDARKRAAGFLGAAKVATFNGWSIGFFAACTIPFAFGSLTALILGVGMAVVARNEFKGRGMLRRIDPEGARFLGRNQVGFMALIVAYCLWSMYGAYAHPDPAIQQQLDLIGVGADTVRQFTIIVYVAVIAATLVFQGLNARYYFARVGRIDAYLRDTPDWIVELQRTVTLD